MNWKNLKDNKCPQCSTALRFEAHKLMHLCDKCDFKITDGRMVTIVNDMYMPPSRGNAYEARDNLEGLNNLGHE